MSSYENWTVLPAVSNCSPTKKNLGLRVADFHAAIHGFTDSVPVCKLHACCEDMQKFRAKKAVLVVVFKVKAEINRI